MTDDGEDIERIRGSGNIFRDFGDRDADLEQLRAVLAAQIIKALDARGLTVRKAAEITGTAAADFLRLDPTHDPSQPGIGGPPPSEVALR